MTASPTTTADSDDDSEDFVVQTITAQDGSVQDPNSALNFTPLNKPVGLNSYGDVDSSSSDSSSDSDQGTQNSPVEKQTSAAPGGDKTAKLEAPKKRKRVTFASDMIDQNPPKPIVQDAQEVKETGEDGLDEEMAAFEAEVTVLQGGREEADVDLAELEDQREQELEDELRTRVINMRKRLRGTESKASTEAGVALTGENLHIQLRDKMRKQDYNHEIGDDGDDDDDDHNINLMADWTELHRSRVNHRKSK